MTVPWWWDSVVYTAWPISGRSPMMTPNAGTLSSMLLQKSPLWKASYSPGINCKEWKECLNSDEDTKLKNYSIDVTSNSLWKTWRTLRKRLFFFLFCENVTYNTQPLTRILNIFLKLLDNVCCTSTLILPFNQ